MESQSSNIWYIRCSVLSSLLLQVLLYFLPPLRRTTRNKWVLYSISMLFSLSTWVPTFTLFLICSCLVFGHENTSNYDPPLLSWAALMLLHIAGHSQEKQIPYHYSLQTSDLAKEFFQIVAKFLFYDIALFGIIFVFQTGKKMPNLAPALMILACLRTFSKLKHLMHQRKEVEALSKADLCYLQNYGASGETTINKFAQQLIQFWQKLFSLHGASHKEREACSEFFRRCITNYSVEILEVELSLIYDNFYGGVLPSISELPVVLCLPFSTTLFGAFAVYIYLLIEQLFLIIALEFRSISSDTFLVPLVVWWATSQKGLNEPEILVDLCIIDMIALICTIPFAVQPWLLKYTSLADHNCDDRFQSSSMGCLSGLYTSLQDFISVSYSYSSRLSRYLSKRYTWSGTIPRFNLLVYSIQKPSKVLVFIHYMLNTWPVFSREPYRGDIGRFIVDQLQKTSVQPFRHLKGQGVLQKNGYQNLVDLEAPLGETMLMWHLATEILYHACSTSTNSRTREISVLLSEYMGYLLIAQPWIMSKQRRDAFRISTETLSETTKLIHSSGIRGHDQSWKEQVLPIGQICSHMKSLVHPQAEDRTQSMIRRACDLAVKIETTFSDVERMWEIIAEVWVEMLAYAAINTDPMNHIRSLSSGGELATIVWLCMLHLGYV